MLRQVEDLRRFIKVGEVVLTKGQYLRVLDIKSNILTVRKAWAGLPQPSFQINRDDLDLIAYPPEIYREQQELKRQLSEQKRKA